MDIQKILQYKSTFDQIVKEIKDDEEAVLRYGTPVSYRRCWDMPDGRISLVP